MHRCCRAVLFTSWQRLVAATPLSGVSGVRLFASESADGDRRRPLPPTYAQKGPRESRPPFPESEDNETRRIRTKPRLKDYTDVQRELMTSAAWEQEIQSLGKYVEAPQYDLFSDADAEEEDFDLECLPDSLQRYNPFTKQVDKFDFSMLHLGKENTSREAKALRWTEENVPLRDDDLPIALRNPETREKLLEAALGPNATPRDWMKIWNTEAPTVMDIDPWIFEEYRKLPLDHRGKKTNVINLIGHPRTLRAAVKYLKVMQPSTIGDGVSSEFLEELSEQLVSGKYKAPYLVPDPPNPYRMEDYEQEVPKKKKRR